MQTCSKTLQVRLGACCSPSDVMLLVCHTMKDTDYPCSSANISLYHHSM